METPREGEEQADEVIDVFATDDRKGEDPKQRQAADEPTRETDAPARGEDDRRQEARDDARGDDDDRDRDPPRRRDESDDDYSRRVRGRINRERALRLRETRRADEQTIANQELRERVQKLERKQKAEDITGDAAKKISELNVKIEACKAKLAAAKEAGETAKELDIQIELTDLLADKKIIERRSEYQAQQAREAAEAPGGDRGGEDPEEQRIARAVSKWQRENRNWFNLRRFSDVRQDAVTLDKELRQEIQSGKLDMQEYSDDHFAELSIRLKELYPDLDVRGSDGERIEIDEDDVDSRRRTDDDDRDTRRGRDRDDDRGRDRDTRRAPPRRHPAGNMGSGDRRRGPNSERQLAEQGRVRLTPADHAQMREYGLDPNDPKAKKRFAQERMRTILTQGRDDRSGGAR